MRLAILAEDVICEDLRIACIEKITQSWDTYMNQPSLKCLLIKEETYKCLLSRLPTSVIVSMTDTPSSCPQSLVLRELQYRKMITYEEISNLPYDELQKRVELDSYQPIIEVIQEEIKFRRDTYPLVNLEDSNLPPGITLEGEGKLVVAAEDLRRYSVVHADHFKKSGGNGRWYFEVTVIACDPYLDGRYATGIQRILCCSSNVFSVAYPLVGMLSGLLWKK